MAGVHLGLALLSRRGASSADLRASPTHPADPTASLSFLSSLHARLAHPHPPPNAETSEATPPPPPPAAEAYALSLSAIAYGKLLLGDLKGTKEAIEESEKLLSELDSVEPSVWAGFYGVSADFFKVNAEYGPYYKNALLYLACVDLRELSADEVIARAHDLAIAALLGESIYNFGELVCPAVSRAAAPACAIIALVSATAVLTPSGLPLRPSPAPTPGPRGARGWRARLDQDAAVCVQRW